MSDVFTRLASALADRYRLERELGAGGMATVYLARDVRHERDVAIKVLRPELAAVVGAQRFLAEIRTTANLQHPHILPLHDSGEVDGTVFYVMPYVAGESLRDRLAREKQLPLDDAVRIATEVADALGAAHTRGIIHRDIKPENILLQDGHALVADFGIALAASNTAGARMTETGMSLGTPMYMSPEQAMGERTLDVRTDVYALGAVLYEMLTGDPPFTGSTAQAIVAKVLTSQPEPVTALRGTVPAGVAETVHAALQKLPADRPASMRAVAEGLKGAGSGWTTAAAGSDRARGASRRAVAAMTGALALAVGAAAWGWLRPTGQRPVLHYQLALDGRAITASLSSGVVAISRDDRKMAVILRDGATSTLWVRSRDQAELTRVPGSENTNEVSFSPDGRQLVGTVSIGLGAAAAGNDALLLRVLSLDGAPPRVLTSTDIGNEGLAWGDDGWIYFDGLTGKGTNGIERIRPDGSAREQLTTVDTARGEVDHVYPVPLPGGRQMLLTVRTRQGPFVAIADIRDRGVTRLVAGANARFVRPGWLLYSSGPSLVAQRFDLRAGRVQGAPVVVASGGLTLGDATDLAVSDAGTLLYLSGQLAAEGGRPHWVDLTGRAVPVDTTIPERAVTVRLSPDGRRLVYALTRLDGPGAGDFFVKSLPEGVPTPVSLPPGYLALPVWAADGRHLYALNDSTGRGSGYQVWELDAAGGDPPRRLPGAQDLGPVEVWRDRLLSFTAVGGAASTSHVIVATPGGGDQRFSPLMPSQRKDQMPRVSPDGRWIAYLTVEGTERVLYLRRFPDVTAGRWLVSNGVVRSVPLWSPDSRTLYFVNQLRQVEAVTLRDDGGDVQVRDRRILFDASGYWMSWLSGWDITPDGSRFVMLPLPTNGQGARLFAIENLPAFLEQRAREGGR